MDDLALNDVLTRTRAAAIAAARTDVNVFAGLILTDETTGKRVRQADVHRRMHAVMDRYDRVVLWGHVESGKSYQVAARVVHSLGRNPTLRIALVGHTYRQVEKTMRFIRTLIETNAVVREVFPHLRPGSPWRENAISIARAINARDPSVAAFGTGGAVLGTRIDEAYLDDVVDLATSGSPHNRAQLQGWVFNTLFGRLTAKARVVVIGNAYHPDDLMHTLAKLDGWHGIRFPVLDAEGNPTWPEQWPLERIERKRAEIGPLEFARSMLCMPRSEEDARFQRSDIDACLDAGKGLGAHLPASMSDWRPDWTHERKSACRFYTGVDLAIQLHVKADVSAIFTIAVHPDGRREIVGLEAGRWPAKEIIGRIADTHRRWGSVVVIENVAAQEWMRQFVIELGNVPAYPFTTGRGKASLPFQAESLAAEIAAHRWIIPCDANGKVHPEISHWLTALLFYNPGAHTPDRMAASLFARDRAFKGDAATVVGTGVTLVGDDPTSAWGGYSPAGSPACWG